MELSSDLTYLSFTMDFRCNLRCTHCMIEGTMDVLRPKTMAELETALRTYTRDEYPNLILTGSEITLNKNLVEMARTAKRHGVRHIRIQTHGMRLADPDYCASLVAAGIDEFFVSVTAADAATHDRITGMRGSFERTLAGLEQLAHHEHVSVLTNTVITAESYQQLSQVVDLLAHLGNLRRFEFWNFFPMATSDVKGLMVSMGDIRPYLLDALRTARTAGIPARVVNYPACLLGEFAQTLDNIQPKLEIDERFWPTLRRSGFGQCPHRDQCNHRDCLGLTSAYVAKFGAETDLLQPFDIAS